MKTIQSIRLTFTEGSSDKEYRMYLLEDSGSYSVDFQFGRRNGSLKAGTKTETPVSLTKAQDIYEKLLKEKMAKGYTPDGDSVSSFVPVSNAAKSKDATLVQLLKEIKTESELQRFLNDDRYCLQEKKDGERRTLDKTDSSIHGGNKKGEIVGLDQTLIDSIANEEDLEIDNELVGDTLFAFDLLRYKGVDLRNKDYKERLDTLYDLNLGFNIVAVRTAFTTEEKLALYNELVANNAEGLVFKDIKGKYTVGRDSSTAYKFKFYKTATVKVVSITKGKRSVKMAVKDGKEFVEVGAVTIPPNKEIPKVGEFAEVRYLYAYKGGSLYQPTYLFSRSDADETDSVIEQLQYKQEA